MQETYLTFVEGASSKFWKAHVEGVTLTVQWGKIGTAGQSQEKTFGTDAEALAAFEKQKAEKVKKGYSEGEGSNVAASPAPRPAKPAESETEPAAAPTPAPKSQDITEPRINLKPEDYARLHWKAPTPPVAPPPFKAFDQEECLKLLRDVCGTTTSYWNWKWDRVNQIRHTLSREEAHFWMAVYDAISQANTYEGILDKLKGQVFDGTLPQGSAIRMVGSWREYGTLMARSLWTLYGADGLVNALSTLNDWNSVQTVESLEKKLFPVLTAAERTELSQALLPYLTPTSATSWALRLGAALGTNQDVIHNLVVNLSAGGAKPRYFSNHYSNHLLIAILALGDPDLIAREARRTEALPTHTEDVRALLAATEFRCLDLIVQSICSVTSKADAERLTKVLQLAEGPETATAMVTVYVNSKVPNLARDWWEKFPTFAIQGLATICGEKSKRGEVALEWLSSFKKREGADRIEAALEELPEPIVQTVREKVLSVTEEDEGTPLTDEEAPAWVKEVFGGELTVADAPADENPPRKLNVTEADKPAPLSPLGPPQAMPPVPPFDLDRCLGQLLPMFTGQYWALGKGIPNFPMSREEAHFWLEAAAIISTGQWRQQMMPSTVETKLRPISFGKDINEKPLTKQMYPTSRVAIWTLFGVDGVLKYLLEEQHVRALGKTIVPYLTEAQRQEFEKKLPETVVELTKKDSHFSLMGAFVLMEQLRFTPEQFKAALSPISNSPQVNYWYTRQYLPYVVRLPDAESILTIAGRLNMWPHDEAGARKWLAVTGWAGVPTTLRLITDSYYDKSEAAKVYSLIESPDVARAMLTLRKFPSSKLVARSWLDRFPAFAIEGLAPLLVSADKKEVALVTDFLRELKRKGYGWLIQKKLSGFPEPVQKVLQTKVLDYDPRTERQVTAGDKALAAMLPPVKVRIPAGLRYLSPAQMAMLVAELRLSPLSEPAPVLEMVRANADRLSLDKFAWALFEDWLQEAAPSKDRWKMEALGHLGSDATALKLTPLVRAWPGENQHQRAVVGLEVLRAIGTDTALMQINGIAQKVSFKGIKERAKECMDAIAADRGFSPEELSDRIIPDGGLDERGTRVFDFGPRSFTFALGPDLKPALKDETGKRLPDLPKPNAKDDEAKAAEAVASWKLLKKQVAEVAKTQAARLEQAMVIGRRWTPTEFQQLLVEHPLMGLLVQRLIWATYDEAGKPLRSFRVADDRTLADENDGLWEIPETAVSIGIVHPSHLDPAQQSAWGEQLSDYDIIAPFVQLGRPTFTLTDAEKKQPYLTRFGATKVDPKVLIFGLDNLGWTRGTPQDGGGFYCHHKVFGDAIAVVVYEEGVWAGDNGDSWEPQKVTGLGFVAEKRLAEDGFFSFEYGETKQIPLSNIDPVVLSEVIYDVTRLVEKGKKA